MFLIQVPEYHEVRYDRGQDVHDMESPHMGKIILFKRRGKLLVGRIMGLSQTTALVTDIIQIDDMEV